MKTIKRCICGNNRFFAHQIVRMHIITDEEGKFCDNMPGGIESAIYDAESPYGPFECSKCKREYDALESLYEIEIISTFLPDYVHASSLWCSYKVYDGGVSNEKKTVSKGYTFINPMCMNRNKIADILGCDLLDDSEIQLLCKSESSMRKLLEDRIASSLQVKKIDLSKCSKITKYCAEKLESSKGKNYTLTLKDFREIKAGYHDYQEFIEDVINNRSGRYQYISEYVEAVNPLTKEIFENGPEDLPVIDFYAGFLTYFEFINRKDRK